MDGGCTPQPLPKIISMSLTILRLRTNEFGHGPSQKLKGLARSFYNDQIVTFDPLSKEFRHPNS